MFVASSCFGGGGGALFWAGFEASKQASLSHSPICRPKTATVGSFGSPAGRYRALLELVARAWPTLGWFKSRLPRGPWSTSGHSKNKPSTASLMNLGPGMRHWPVQEKTKQAVTIWLLESRRHWSAQFWEPFLAGSPISGKL